MMVASSQHHGPSALSLRKNLVTHWRMGGPKRQPGCFGEESFFSRFQGSSPEVSNPWAVCIECDPPAPQILSETAEKSQITYAYAEWMNIQCWWHLFHTICPYFRDSTVGTATLLAGRSGDRIPVEGRGFRHCPDRLWVPPSPLNKVYRVFPGGWGVMRPGRLRWQPTPI